MNRAQRIAHRRTFVALLAVVPLGFAAALAGRSPLPSSAALPDDPASARAPADFVWVGAWMASGLSLSLGFGQAGERRLVELMDWGEPASPDVLLYWCAHEPQGGALPLDAVLLGSLGAPENAPRRLDLPPDAGRGGWLALYSLGHAEVLGALSLEAD